MSTEQGDAEEQALQGFVARTLRRNEQGAYEQTLCLHLVRATGAPPIEKIRLVSEAAMMPPNTPVDREKLEVIHKVVTALTSTEVNIANQEHWHGGIPWPFRRSEENYHRYIEPWAIHPSTYTRGLRAREYERKQEIRKKWGQIEDPAKLFWFQQRYYYLHLAGYESLKSQFISWATPHVMKMFQQLSRLVSPDLYMEMLERVRA
jgi:hypothetical protein